MISGVEKVRDLEENDEIKRNTTHSHTNTSTAILLFAAFLSSLKQYIVGFCIISHSFSIYHRNSFTQTCALLLDALPFSDVFVCVSKETMNQ